MDIVFHSTPVLQIPKYLPNGQNSFVLLKGLQSSASVVLKKKTWFPRVRCLSLNNNIREDIGDGDDDVNPNGEGEPPAFQTLSAEITPVTDQFFVSDAKGDPDRPSEGFSSIEQALNAIRQGKFVIAVDDEDRENEGDLIMAASSVTTEAMGFMVKHGTGIVCVGMTEEDLERLKLPLMVPNNEEETLTTAFTVSVDAKFGTSTGVSAADRAVTVLALASSDSNPEDLQRPGHVFPVKYKNGGVLKRAGYTEASVDLVTLAGLRPVSVHSRVVVDDGSMACLTELQKFAMEYNLPIISIADLI
ncbi:hypothetical protein KI387_006436, partial [Taxus chinensis]